MLLYHTEPDNLDCFGSSVFFYILACSTLLKYRAPCCQMSLKIDTSSWSEPFALDAVGTHGIIKCSHKGITAYAAAASVISLMHSK